MAFTDQSHMQPGNPGKEHQSKIAQSNIYEMTQNIKNETKLRNCIKDLQLN